MKDPKDLPVDDGDRTAGGGIVDPRTDGTIRDDPGGPCDDTELTGVNEVISGRYGSDVD